jgi:RHH-type proline utilization regulon transcriptional repressor/proline dehydrogenase/delta 1-pyrroline-5-carboxylate dehydrogenase
VFRGRLIEVMAAETGKTVAEGCRVSEAVDFAITTPSGRAARDDRGAVRAGVPRWSRRRGNRSIAAGGVFPRSPPEAVCCLPGPRPRSGAVVAEALWEAGIPRSGCARRRREALGRQLVTAPRWLVVLTGSSGDGGAVRSWRSDLPLLPGRAARTRPSPRRAPTSTSPSPTSSRARSQRGQRCSAAPPTILVGSVMKSGAPPPARGMPSRLPVGWPQDVNPMGPVIEPVAGS